MAISFHRYSGILTTSKARTREAARFLGFIFIAGILLSGCGHSGVKLHPVSGKVTFQGRPVAAGMIRFSNPKAGVDMMAQLQPDGGYEIVQAQGKGLPVGDYQIAIMPPRANIPLGPMKAPTKQQTYPEIPERYRSPTTSGLLLTIKPDTGPFNVDMTP
jgi:hypothetical protein